MSLLPLTMAAADYDRFHALRDGSVRVEGIDLEIVTMEVEEVFYRQVKYAEFDVSEMSLSTYVLSLERDDFPYVAIPVFPSRYFRHQSIFINQHSGITSPKDLRGKRVGVPEYQITASVWQRGILSDDFGVSPSDMRWFTGGVEQRGREEKQSLSLPSEVEVTAIGNEATLSEMLADGDIDALFTAHEPSAFHNEDHVTRLFSDHKEVEKAYFSRTGILPIMHVMVIRRSVLERHPWVARSLYKAFDTALQHAKQSLLYRSSLTVMLPWLADHVEETVSALGEDYWTYGIDSNRNALETFLRYSYDQGLAQRKYSPEEIFAPSTVSAFTI